jgi:predicted metal-dependent phosphotriesterase family hydrolase|tara:strand:- start:1353 stop:1745 length:393 start_codon:yes stop_codon:yes gene_type:complete
MVDVTPDKLTKAFLKIRAERAVLQAEFKEKEAKLARQQDRIKQAMLDHCEKHNAESIRTSEGLFFRSRRTKYWTSDWDAMHNFIIEHNVPQLLDKRINQSNLKEFLEENPDTTPRGLETETEVVISVRKK